jgi:hypothetical protein
MGLILAKRQKLRRSNIRGMRRDPPENKRILWAKIRKFLIESQPGEA